MINLLTSSSEELVNFWDSDAWGFLMVLSALLVSLIVANVLKKQIGFLRKSMMPTSVIAGVILLIISFTYAMIKGKNPDGTWDNIFNLPVFGGNGLRTLYIIAYHGLAIGFIASTLKSTKRANGKNRGAEVFNTGVTTVSTYLIQAVLGLGITLILAYTVMPDLFPASGVILPFGYGQGTGQALNWGTVYQTDYGFEGGANFGLTVAALGFLSASIGGVIYLNVMKRKGKLVASNKDVSDTVSSEEIKGPNETPFVESIDKLSIQLAFVLLGYVISYVLMWGISKLIPSMQATIYGFNFLFGVLSALLIKLVIKLLKSAGAVKKDYVNNFLMDRISGFAFDLMIVAGFAAIELQLLADYWLVLLIICVVGAVATFFYNLFIARKFFPDYADEQFMAMYGMLTGTASTGMMLLREVAGSHSYAQDNLVYQNLPAIVFGFPMMLLAGLAPNQPILTLIILVAFFIVMNIILFRRQIFLRGKSKN